MQTDVERIAHNLVRNEVHLCLSSMVATLAKGNAVLNGRGSYINGEFDELCEQAAELCAPIDDWEEAAIQAGWPSHTLGLEPDSPTAQAEDASNATAQTYCEDNEIEPYQREIFEHWAVSQRLAEDLASLGERVDTDFAGLCVWGRTTTGQMIEMDSVIQRVAQLVHDRAKAITEEVA